MKFLIYALMIEFFFGLNGRQLLIGDEPIRSVLYYSAVFLLCVKGVYYLFQRIKMHRKQGFFFLQALWKEVKIFKPFDIILAIFLLLHAIWIFLIPYMQLVENPSAMQEAYNSALPIVYMAIYFPTVYLIRIGKVEWEKYKKLAIFGCVAIGFVHLFLYVGESIQRTIDPSICWKELLWHGIILLVVTVTLQKYLCRFIRCG